MNGDHRRFTCLVSDCLYSSFVCGCLRDLNRPNLKVSSPLVITPHRLQQSSLLILLESILHSRPTVERVTLPSPLTPQPYTTYTYMSKAMPPKKAAGSATVQGTKAKPIANGVAKAVTQPATKKAAAKAPAKATTKATPKTPVKKPVAKPAAKTATKAGTKRKAEEDVEEPRINGVKKQRSQSKSATPAPPKRKATPKPAAPRKPRKKIVINSPPTTRLDVYVFGDGSNAELGLGTAKGCIEVKRPRLNPFLKAGTVGVIQISVGGMHTAVLTHDNKILTWGVNDQSALGRDTNWEGGLRDIDDDKSDNSSADGSDTGLNPRESLPSEVDVSGLPEDIVWTQLACSDSATFALTDEGQVYGWGTFRVSRPPSFSERILNVYSPTKASSASNLTSSSRIVQLSSPP